MMVNKKGNATREEFLVMVLTMTLMLGAMLVVADALPVWGGGLLTTLAFLAYFSGYVIIAQARARDIGIATWLVPLHILIPVMLFLKSGETQEEFI